MTEQYENNNKNNIETTVSVLQERLPQYSGEAVEEAYTEVEELKERGELFAEDEYQLSCGNADADRGCVEDW